MSKVLVIRMLELGDVASIALPAIRHVKKNVPEAQISCLTHGLGEELLRLAEPGLSFLSLPNGHWPDDIVQGLEAFMGLAGDIVGIQFDQIINLDTGFLPCFLARFLKDAGEPVEGNFLSVSIPRLIEQIQQQSLQAQYVNDPSQYMQSTFLGMLKWHTQWWTSPVLPEKGYAEFYLKTCCGFNTCDMNDTVAISDKDEHVSSSRVSIYLALDDVHLPYLHIDELQQRLTAADFIVSVDDPTWPLDKRLALLASSQLVVCSPNAVFAFAKSVKTATLLLPGELDPRLLMPDYSAPQGPSYPAPGDLIQSIQSIFESENND